MNVYEKLNVKDLMTEVRDIIENNKETLSKINNVRLATNTLSNRTMYQELSSSIEETMYMFEQIEIDDVKSLHEEVLTKKKNNVDYTKETYESYINRYIEVYLDKTISREDKLSLINSFNQELVNNDNIDCEHFDRIYNLSRSLEEIIFDEPIV